MAFENTVAGIHHVSVIAGPARSNIDFYTRILGMRLVKKTVNFDDPASYHLYYGDETGQPGTALTFFPWEHAAPGRFGAGETLETALRIPESAFSYWLGRFADLGVATGQPVRRFGETVLPFEDRDGVRLALVALPGLAEEAGWSDGTIPEEHAIRGFHSVTFDVVDTAPTAAVLTDVLGFTEAAREGDVLRLEASPGGAGPGGVVNLRKAASATRGRTGHGTVHHVAFRAADDEAEATMVQRLKENHNLLTTEQRDRFYFRSVYFREPGGVLFEIATDKPGFTADESLADLGKGLMLPPFLEGRREDIVRGLPDLG